MPAPCRLCACSEREEVDKFLASGESYAAFQSTFPTLASIHQSSVSRHRKYHIEAKPSEKEFQEYCAADTVRAKRKIIRELVALARRARAKGKIAEQINALVRISTLHDEIRALEQERAPAQPGAPVVEMRPIEEIEAQLIEFCRSDAGAEYFRWLMVKAGHEDVYPRLAYIPNRDVVRELLGNRGLRARYRMALLEAEERLHGSSDEPNDFIVSEDWFPEASCGAENVSYRGPQLPGDWQACHEAGLQQAAKTSSASTSTEPAVANTSANIGGSDLLVNGESKPEIPTPPTRQESESPSTAAGKTKNLNRRRRCNSLTKLLF